MEFDNKWAAGKKYLDMGEYLQCQEEQKQPHVIPKVAPLLNKLDIIFLDTA
jgi:hypothetical protein